MSDQPKRESRLSEISHLFLSSVREKQTQGAPCPQRRPPQSTAQAVSSQTHIDNDGEVTVEEMARVIGQPPSEPAKAPARVAAILGAHLGAGQHERALEYAAHVAKDYRRVGLIEIDSMSLRVWTLEAAGDCGQAGTPVATPQALDARRMSELLHELAHDVDQWLVLLPSLRDAAGLSLLRSIGHWVLLVSCQGDGVVSAYRTLKGMRDVWGRAARTMQVPRLSLGILDAHSAAEATRTYARLSGVSEQFLCWTIESQRTVMPSENVLRHHVVSWQSTDGKVGRVPTWPWQVLSDFLSHMQHADHGEEHVVLTDEGCTETVASGSQSPAPALRCRLQSAQTDDADPSLETASAHSRAPEQAHADDSVAADATSDVLDLPDGPVCPSAIIDALLKGRTDLVRCPIHPPKFSAATVAVRRDRRLVLIAVSHQGLRELHQIGNAYRWLIENRRLVAMALPQFAIDAHQHPTLLLLVDHADASAELLQSIVRGDHVSVQSYRRLRWNGRTGLLLEAA